MTITDHSDVVVVAVAAVHIFAQRGDAQRSGATSPSLQEGACGLRKRATRNARNCITEVYGVNRGRGREGRKHSGRGRSRGKGSSSSSGRNKVSGRGRNIDRKTGRRRQQLLLLLQHLLPLPLWQSRCNSFLPLLALSRVLQVLQEKQEEAKEAGTS